MSTEHHVISRRIIRTEKPIWPLWMGLIPLLLLLLLFAYSCARFAPNDIEAEVQERIRQDLSAAGLDWVNVTTDGQQVTLGDKVPAPVLALLAQQAGSVPDALKALKKKATDIAQRSTCSTWTGQRVCATGVTTNFTGDAAAVPTKKAPNLTWPDTRAELKEGMIILTGEVPDAKMRTLLADLATTKVAPPRIKGVQNDLVVTDKRAPAAYVPLAERAVTTVAQSESGWAAITKGVFSANAMVHQSDLDAMTKKARAPVEGARIGTVTFLPIEAVTACEDALTALMKSAQIKFSTGSATIAASSKALLDRVAAAAKGCPGTLDIEGHTDAQGSMETNMTLSQARADAVKAALAQRGVDTSHLVAHGFGPKRPAATNDTAAGRAKNRRIEFHVVRDAP